MSFFRRKPAPTGAPEPDEEAAQQESVLTVEDEAEEAAAEKAAAAEELRRAQGPFDVSEVDDDVEWVDLAALKIRIREGMELRMEVVEADQIVRSVTAVLGESQAQLQVFSGPRTLGVWDEIRAELAQEISRQGGTAEEREGVFGEEILARLPVRTSDGRTGHRPTRFVGIDGPRWFLRALISGQAVTDPSAADDIESVIKSCVVSRGPEALPPRELLPLKLPDGAKLGAGGAAAEAAAEEEDAGERQPLAPPERGPEITEIR